MLIQANLFLDKKEWFKYLEKPRNFTVRIKSFDFFSIFINIAHNAHTKRKNYV